jgi:hypothetical protein
MPAYWVVAATPFESGVVVGRILFYVVLIVVLVAVAAWLWRRRRHRP